MYLQYKKQSKKDPAMPKDLPSRRTRCIEWMQRPSPLASPHPSDDKDDIVGPSAEAVAGLLGLSNNFIGKTAEDVEYDNFFTNRCEDEM